MVLGFEERKAWLAGASGPGGENRAVAGVSVYVSGRCGEETGGSVFVTFSVLCFGPGSCHVNPVRWAARGHRSPWDTEPGQHRAGGGAGRSPQRSLALTRHGRREREACLTRTAHWRHEEAGLHGWCVQRAVSTTPRACPLVGPVCCWSEYFRQVAFLLMFVQNRS